MMRFDQAPNLNYLWTGLMVEELIRHGVDYFCIAPGSRSAPLAGAVALHPRARSFIHYDERGLAFHALGFVSAVHKPAVLISTSGTAVANFFPAVVEASKRKLPLILLTADRPPEVRKTGADQTIDQPGIFGEYVRWQVDLPCPDEHIKPSFVLTTIDQAVYRSQQPLAGPVHLNCPFREPLAPLKTKGIGSGYWKDLQGWQNRRGAYTRYLPLLKSIPAAGLKETADILNKIKHGVVVVGKLSTDQERLAVLRLAQKLNWPVFADITSGLRLGSLHKNLIPYFAQILLWETARVRFPLDGILHLGGRITSKRWYQWVEKRRPHPYVMVLNHSLRHDPLHSVSLRVESAIEPFCQGIWPLIKTRASGSVLTRFQKVSSAVDRVLNEFEQKQDSLNEPMIARWISRHIPAGSGLFLANSMPIREMDMYGVAGKKEAVIQAHRGASGIDGTIAAAAGFAIGLNKPVTLLIGDLAFLYDLNSLAMLAKAPQPVVIVVLNNDGGAIFSFLPVARIEEWGPHRFALRSKAVGAPGGRAVFEKYFGTPHGLTFEHAAALFGLSYFSPASPEEFLRAYQKALKQKGSSLIEVRGDRDENYKVHRDLQKAIEKAMRRV